MNKSKPEHLDLFGDFNCPDTDWDKLCFKHTKTTQDRNEQHYLIETMSELNLSSESKIKRQVEKYRHFAKEVKRNILKAKWIHVNNVIKDNIEQNNTKPLFSYCKSKKARQHWDCSIES